MESRFEQVIRDIVRRLRALESRTGSRADPAGRVVWQVVPGAPDGWLIADGQQVTSDYPVLRAALVAAGNPHGAASGNPLLPNLVGKFARGANTPGGTGGADTVALSVAELPSHPHGAGTLAAASNGTHSHTFDWHSATDVATGTAVGMFAPDVSSPNRTRQTSMAGAHGHTITGSTAAAGGGEAHENRPPYVDLTPLVRAY